MAKWISLDGKTIEEVRIDSKKISVRIIMDPADSPEDPLWIVKVFTYARGDMKNPVSQVACASDAALSVGVGDVMFNLHTLVREEYTTLMIVFYDNDTDPVFAYNLRDRAALHQMKEELYGLVGEMPRAFEILARIDQLEVDPLAAPGG